MHRLKTSNFYQKQILKNVETEIAQLTINRPDGLGPSGILLEVKTRAEGCVWPIITLAKFSQ